MVISLNPCSNLNYSRVIHPTGLQYWSNQWRNTRKYGSLFIIIKGIVEGKIYVSLIKSHKIKDSLA